MPNWPRSACSPAPDDPFRQRRTVDPPGGSCPEPPSPGFASHVDGLLASIAGFAGR
ncbi:hypothetical protein ACFORO_29860 [Amycolatopsis halotolerans]|uniref:Uncharacterized protein n=1 Tax=Amycolatopsis halotolerans TaxID=330083 RepID=A0ABV7QQ59_9PSEU